MSALRSMTGFSQAEASLPEGRAVSVRVKSVNARHLELQVRLPAGLDALEPELRAMVKRTVRRGHVEVAISAERAAGRGDAVHLDEALLLAYVEAHRRAAERFGLAGEPDLNVLLRVPGVLSAREPDSVEDVLFGAARDAAQSALEGFVQSREAEGATLGEELRASVARMAELVEEAARLRREVSTGAAERLRQRIAELAGEQIDLPPERVLGEAALLVARGDVEEELVRLRTHLQRFLDLLAAGGEAGKPLEFLLQELGRETNTLMSKTGGSAGEAGLRLTDLGLAMKVELERAREQVMNLE